MRHGLAMLRQFVGRHQLAKTRLEGVSQDEWE